MPAITANIAPRVTSHNILLDTELDEAEPVIFTQVAGDWRIDAESGNLATGEEWFDNTGVRRVAISLLTCGVSSELVRQFVDGQPAGPSTPVY